jgi:hypothetical protein
MNQFNPNPSTIYQIRVKGHLDDRWSDWFDDLTITLEADSNTLLTGPVVDQCALYGLLKKVHDLGLPLISINQVEKGGGEQYRIRK